MTEIKSAIIFEAPIKKPLLKPFILLLISLNPFVIGKWIGGIIGFR